MATYNNNLWNFRLKWTSANRHCKQLDSCLFAFAKSGQKVLEAGAGLSRVVVLGGRIMGVGFMVWYARKSVNGSCWTAAVFGWRLFNLKLIDWKWKSKKLITRNYLHFILLGDYNTECSIYSCRILFINGFTF